MPNDVIQQFVPDGNGNLVSERYYGGDNSPIWTSGDLCQPLLPAPEYTIDHSYSYGVRNVTRYSTAGYFSLYRGIDPSTGLPA